MSMLRLTFIGEIGRRFAVDQALRNFDLSGVDVEGYDRPVDQVLLDHDRENTAWVRQMISQHGWPRISEVGPAAAQQFWMLAQHADTDPALQETCLALMEPLVDQGEASRSMWAYMTDRVLRHKGQPQSYGTQLVHTEHGWEPPDLADPDDVDVRRAAASLEPLADYIDSHNT